jgi:Tfp pilus assembly protein PilF
MEQQLKTARSEAAQNNVRLAKAYLKQKKSGLAGKAALRAFDLDPNNEEAQMILGQLKGGAE